MCGPPPWAGTRQLGSSAAEEATAVATDIGGNVYVAGYTEGSLDGNTSAGNRDLFVVKYNASGVKQWTRQLGTSDLDEARGVATDSGGNVYVAGSTGGSLDGNTSAGNFDGFVVKYNAIGVKQWTRQLGTSDADNATGVATDTGGNVYVAGSTAAGLDGNASAGGGDIFVAKYNTNGVKQWTRQLGTSGYEELGGLTTDTGANVYLVGSTAGGLDGNTNAGSDDLFLVKYDTNGVKQWTRQAGSSTGDYPFGVGADAGGNLYVAGHTAGGLDGNTNAGAEDLFVVKYDARGVKQWTRQLGTNSSDVAFGVATDTSGNVYVAGYTTGGLDGNTSAGSIDLIVVKYGATGAKQWTRQLGTMVRDLAWGVATDTGGNAYVAGYTEGGLDGNTSAGSSDLIVVKYSSNGVKQ